jgi:hypothetical protein
MAKCGSVRRTELAWRAPAATGRSFAESAGRSSRSATRQAREGRPFDVFSRFDTELSGCKHNRVSFLLSAIAADLFFLRRGERPGVAGLSFCRHD